MKISNKPPKQITTSNLDRELQLLRAEFEKILLVNKVAKTYTKKPKI